MTATRPTSWLSPAVRGRMLSGEAERPAVWRVPEEQPLVVLINGERFAVMMTTPADLEDFALGFALTEGIVDDVARIDETRIADLADGVLCNIVLAGGPAAAASGRRRSIAGRSGCGVCGAQTLDAALPRLPKVRGPIPSPATLSAAYAALPAAQPMNAENRSTHAAAFCDRTGRIVVVREDIGRHNALDKLCGALARASLRAADGFILLSSRISVEMVQKAAMIGAPVLAAVSAPSALALRQAAEAGMALACRARDDVMIFDPGTEADQTISTGAAKT